MTGNNFSPKTLIILSGEISGLQLQRDKKGIVL